MRGTDFRSQNIGLCLIVDAPFSSQSAKDQGLARVGRNGEQCRRLRTDRFLEPLLEFAEIESHVYEFLENQSKKEVKPKLRQTRAR